MHMALSTRVSMAEYFSARFDGECRISRRLHCGKTHWNQGPFARSRPHLQRAVAFEQAGESEAFVERSLRLDETVLIPDMFLPGPADPRSYNSSHSSAALLEVISFPIRLAIV